MTEHRLSGRTCFEGNVFSVTVDEVRCPDGKLSSREIVKHNGGIAVLAIDEDENVIIVRQFRYAIGRVMQEIPAGKLEKGENPDTAAMRELSEETGVTCSKLVRLGKIIPTCGYNTEVLWLYLAQGLSYGEAHPDEGELVSYEKVPITRLERMIANGEIEDAKTISALCYYYLVRENMTGGNAGNGQKGSDNRR